MSTRAGAIAATTAVAVGLAGGATIARSQSAAAVGETQRVQSQLSAGGCVIRLYAAGPRIHANSTHTCVGVTRVRVTDMGRLQVYYAQRGRTVSVTANADELLVGRGIQAGANSQATYATITLYDSRLKRRLHLKRPADYRRAAGNTSNVWFSTMRVPS